MPTWNPNGSIEGDVSTNTWSDSGERVQEKQVVSPEPPVKRKGAPLETEPPRGPKRKRRSRPKPQEDSE